MQTDATPTVLFANFGSTAPAPGSFNVTLLGQGGDDSFSIDPQVGLTVNADGGPPTASDRVVIDGTSGSDTVTITPTGPDSATVQVNGLGLVTITTTEGLIFNGHGGNDLLTVAVPAGSTTTYTPGARPIRPASRSIASCQLPSPTSAMGGQAVQILGGPAAGSTLIYNGTTANDTFAVTGVVGPKGHVVLNSQLAVETANVATLTLNGLDGNDSFTVSASANLPYTAINLNGGDPSGSDNVTLNGTAGADTIGLALAATGDTVSGVISGPVTLVGVENLTINSLGGADALSVTNLGGTSDLQTAIFNSGGDALDTFTATGTAGPERDQRDADFQHQRDGRGQRRRAGGHGQLE